MARRRKGNCRGINGILLLDKPVGFTSNQALQKVKGMFRACKAGHTGSLDPIATGVLPLCFGGATKVSQFMLDSDKRYWARVRLGVETTTYDAEGEVVETRPVEVSKRDLERALSNFEGEIQQLPPMYSAIKKDGEALYKLARKGVEVERESRTVAIQELKLLNFADDVLELEMACSKGTYVRSLAHDLGQLLGCGAHVEKLRRLGVGDFDIEETVTLEELEAMSAEEREALILPVDEALHDMPEVSLTSLATHYLVQGQPVSAPHSHDPGLIRLYEEGERFLGIGEVLDDGRVAPKRLMLKASEIVESEQKA